MDAIKYAGRFVLFLVLMGIWAVLQSGCSTQAGYEKVISSWMGAPEEELVRKLGPPESSYAVGATKFLSYSESGTVQLPSQAPTYTAIGSQLVPSGGYRGATIAMGCTAVYEVTNGVVSGWSYRGNQCKR
jgi:hypothetical protein